MKKIIKVVFFYIFILMKNTIRSMIIEILKEAEEKSWSSLSKEEKLKKVLSALGNKIPKNLSEEEMEELGAKIGKKVSGSPFSAITMRRHIRDIGESSLLKEGAPIRANDITGMVNWLDDPSNWEAAATAVSTNKDPKEKDLVDFLKAHREFDDWSWGEVEAALQTADQKNLIESFHKAIEKQKLSEQIAQAITDAFDYGDWELNATAKMETAIENLKKKIRDSKNPQLIDVFDRLAGIEKYRKLFAQHPEIFTKNIDKAAKSQNWEGLSNWLMDLTRKTTDQQINEFIQKEKKTI